MHKLLIGAFALSLLGASTALADPYDHSQGEFAALADLATIGYFVRPDTEAVVVAAFQRRFRPERWDGRLDGETSQRLSEVRAAYDRSRQRPWR